MTLVRGFMVMRQKCSTEVRAVRDVKAMIVVVEQVIAC
jgi:hypothetical protein